MTRSYLITGVFTLLLAVGCKTGKGSDNPDEGIELPPEREVADTQPKPKPEPKPAKTDPVEDEKVAAQKVEEPTAPAVAPPQDRDQNLEKAKMKRSRQKSGKAKELLRNGQADKAIAEARDALRDHEQNVEAMLVIAEAFYKQGKHELVLSVTGSILKVDEKILTPEEKSQALNLMGFAYLQVGKRGDAFRSFKNAAEADANNASAWNNLGVQYMWRGDFPTAEGCFEYAVSLDGKFTEAQLNWGAALRANGKLAEAEKAWQQVAKMEPNWAEVHFNLGVLYLDADQIPTLDETAKLRAAIREFESYKTLVATGKTSIERSKQQRGPTDAMGNELVSVAQADLYIKAANKGIESEQRKAERDAKRKQREAEQAEAAAAEAQAQPEAPTDGEQPAQPQPDAEQPAAPAQPPAEQPAAPAQPPAEQPSQPQQPGGQPPSQPTQPPSQPQQPGGQPPSQPTQPTQPSQPQQPQKPGAQKPQSPQNPQSPQKPQKPGG
jgi:tetratricopeptide (TPR) repeat protein